MHVLVIGGTSFLGPHVVEALRRERHTVTLFNRGRNAPRPHDVEQITGDRDGDIERLAGRAFDAVIDTCGYVPRVVHRAVDLLADRVSHYTFVSTISVYAESLHGVSDETAPLATMPDPSVEQVTPETYGPLKALCEAAVREALPGRCSIVRPGLIVGPLDPTDRFTYWPHRAALGGDMLVPGTRAHHISFIDVRDLADFIVRGIGRGLTGTFNASGDTATLTMGALIDACVEQAGTGARPVWVDEAFLREHDVAPWAELPAWLPEGEDALLWASSARAVHAGLTYRPLADTVRATLEWTRGRGLDRQLRAGLAPEREADLLARWHERSA